MADQQGAVRCVGVSRGAVRCKNHTISLSKLCHLHSGQDGEVLRAIRAEEEAERRERMLGALSGSHPTGAGGCS